MPDPAPEPDPQQPAPGQPSATAPGQGQPAAQQPMPGSLAAAGRDGRALVDALAVGGLLDDGGEDQDAAMAEGRAAWAEGRVRRRDPAELAAVAVEHMGPGPAQAGWLEQAAGSIRGLGENALAGVAIAARQAAAHAQALELAAVAQIAARAAEADPKIGVGPDGRPARVGRDALGQISLALTLTRCGAEDWADLAVTLTWRLPGTGRALAAGGIDLKRARLIAEATSVLTEAQAQAVEQVILPDAGTLTRPELRGRLTHAVIAADPGAAERRRQAGERAADVRLYPDDDHTASLVASKQPQIHAAAGFARLNAMARARKAAGLPGSLGLHRSQILLGLLLGTLPPIPPAEGAPPDNPSPSDDPGPGYDGGPGRPDEPDSGRPGDSRPGGSGPGFEGGPGDGGPGQPDDSRPGDGGPSDGGPSAGGPWDELPAPRDEDAPPEDGLDNLPDPDVPGWDPDEDDDDPAAPTPTWPQLGVIPPGLTRPAGPADGRPVPGLLDAVLPWTTLAGLSQRPGTLGRVGPVDAGQARLLARAAAADPAAQWRVIVTNAAGQALAVTRIRRPRRRTRDGPARDGPAACRDRPPPGTGLVGRSTVTITADMLAATEQAGGPDPPRPPAGPGPPAHTSPPGVLAAVADAALRAAARALARASQRAAADQAAGGCAHTSASPAYRPPPRLREQVTARDQTCRNPVCRQPAWRADLDHTRPWKPRGHGGPTCLCNLGGGCRSDHQLKQNPRWNLEQTRPGYFTWTTPAGRTYTKGPDTHPT